MPQTEFHRDRRQSRLLTELRDRRRDLSQTYGPAVLIALAGFAIAWFFVEPAPPNELEIATAHRDGNYFASAQAYAEVFDESGVTLHVRETAGSVENYRLLLEGEVDAAMVQGGTAPEGADVSNLESLATLYLEPVWVFHRKELSLERLAQLTGRRIAIAEEGSGTYALAMTLLHANEVRDGEGQTEFVRLGGRSAASLLQAGEVDAAFFVLSAASPLIRELLLSDQLRLLSIERNQAYSRRFPFLESVTLEPGVIDLALDLPREPVRLIAPAANLVATRELHDAFIPLLLEAATDVHSAGGLLTETGAHPSLDAVEFPPNESARQYLTHGPSFFQRHLSFWVASLIDRTKIMLVPLLMLLVPLIKLAPPVYRWRIRSRIFRWYDILRRVDQSLQTEGHDELADYERKLITMERELEEVTVPLAYMEEFYNLHLHIDLVKRRLARRRGGSAELLDETEVEPLRSLGRPASR